MTNDILSPALQILDYSVLSVHGDDAHKFLQNLITNDLDKLFIRSGAIYSLLLTPNGRFFADFFVLRYNHNTFLLIVPTKLSINLLAKLFFYKLRSCVEISDVTDIYTICYSHSNDYDTAILSYKDPRYERMGYFTLFETTIFRNLNVNTTSSIYFDDKYNYTIPDGLYDFEQDRSMPPEWGVEHLNAVSFAKGCYIGQELISRTKHLGEIRKFVYLVSTVDSVLSTDDVVMCNDTELGVISSVYGNRAIALLRLAYDKISDDYFYIKEKNAKCLLRIAPWYIVN